MGTYKFGFLPVDGIDGTREMGDHILPDCKIIDAVPDIRKNKRGCCLDIHRFKIKFFFVKFDKRFCHGHYALLHFTPSRVSLRTMPISRSLSLISSAFAKSFALRAA